MLSACCHSNAHGSMPCPVLPLRLLQILLPPPGVQEDARLLPSLLPVLVQEELGVRAARLKGITDVVPTSRNGSADSDSGDDDSDAKKAAGAHTASPGKHHISPAGTLLLESNALLFLHVYPLVQPDLGSVQGLGCWC